MVADEAEYVKVRIWGKCGRMDEKPPQPSRGRRRGKVGLAAADDAGGAREGGYTDVRQTGRERNRMKAAAIGKGVLPNTGIPIRYLKRGDPFVILNTRKLAQINKRYLLRRLCFFLYICNRIQNLILILHENEPIRGHLFRIRPSPGQARRWLRSANASIGSR